MSSLRKIDLQLMSELIKNCRRSDRDLAKAIGTSQPTITRRRTKLEKERLIESYTAIPNFATLGFEIMAFSFYSWRHKTTGARALKDADVFMERFHAFLAGHKNIIFTSNGHGFEMDTMMMSVHKSYADYVKLMKAVNNEYGNYLLKTNSFIVSLQDVVGRIMSFRHFADYILKEL